MNPRHRSAARAAALFVALFLAGLVTGVAVEREWAKRRITVELAGMGMESGLPSVFDELDLTPAQRAEILAVSERMRSRSEILVNSTLPELQLLADSMDLQIRRVLTPGQRRKLDRILGDIGRIEVPAPGVVERAPRPAGSAPRGTIVMPGNGSPPRHPTPGRNRMLPRRLTLSAAVCLLP